MKLSPVLAISALMILGCTADIDSTAELQMSEADLAMADLQGSSTQNQQLAEARSATAQYHEIEAALADGYFQASPCVEAPPGAMGHHYVNLDRAMAPPDIRTPAVLLYLPTESGELRLVGLEYTTAVMTANGPYFGCGVGNASCPPEGVVAPELFDGQKMDGPVPPRAPGAPWQWEQHVWIWSWNPSGTFAPFNPRLSCEFAN